MDTRQEIEYVLASWALGYDERDVPRMVDCFTPDANMTLVIGDEVIPLVGRDEVIGHMTEHHGIQKDQRRHVVTNVVIEPEAEAGVRQVTSYLTLLVTENGELRLQATGVYRDRFVKTDIGWRIAERHLTLDVHY